MTITSLDFHDNLTTIHTRISGLGYCKGAFQHQYLETNAQVINPVPGATNAKAYSGLVNMSVPNFEWYPSCYRNGRAGVLLYFNQIYNTNITGKGWLRPRSCSRMTFG